MASHPEASRTPAAASPLLRGTLLGLAFGFPFLLMMGKSITGDEIAHIPAGYSYLATGEIVLNPMHPPLIKELCALPLMFLHLDMPADAATIRAIGKDFTYQWEFGEQFLRRADLTAVLFWSRVPAAIFSFLLAAVVMAWATELWGIPGGILALLLHVFDPNITAHAQFVTTDIGCALFSTLFFYLLWRYVRAPSSSRWLAAGLGLGLALGAKFSCVVLLPLAALSLAFAALTSPKPLWRLLVAGAAFLGICLIAYVVLWAIYMFPADPLFYVRGLRDVKGDYDARYLHFFMGELRHESWRAYFLVALLIKTPIPELAFIASAVVLALRGMRRSWIDEAFVVVPLLGLFAGYSLLADPIGVRYVIPCLPFAFVFTARVGAALATAPRVLMVAAAGLVVWLVVEFAAIWPDHLSYFNQVAGGWRGGTEWLDDSNVDWGQGYLELRQHLKSHPATNARLCNFGPFNPSYYGFDGKLIWLDDLLDPPTPGSLILSSHCVARVRAWLRTHPRGPSGNWLDDIEPQTIVGHVYWIYEIPGRPPA